MPNVLANMVKLPTLIFLVIMLFEARQLYPTAVLNGKMNIQKCRLLMRYWYFVLQYDFSM